MTPQPVHEMVPILAIFSFVLLGLLTLVAAVLNRFRRKPWVNGSKIFFWFLLTAVVGFNLYSYTDERITLQGHRIIGQATFGLLPALIVSFFLGRRFRRKQVVASGAANAI